MKKQTKNKKPLDYYFLEYQYAVGLTLGLLYGWYAQDKVIGFIVLILFLVLIERFF